MSCDSVQTDLVGYHFGMLGSESRTLVETHLGECRACVAAFIATKRALEFAEEEEAPAPSAVAHKKLRLAIARELDRERGQRAWWERPLAFAVAASLVLCAEMANRRIAGVGSAPYAISAAQREPAR